MGIVKPKKEDNEKLSGNTIEKKEKSAISLAMDLLRVEPPSNLYDEKTNKSDRLTDLLIGLTIFAIAFWFRFLFRSVFLGEYTKFVFNLTISDNDPFGFGKFLGLNPGDTANTEGYHDYYTYYIPYVKAFGDGWNPYTGSTEPGNKISGYVYGPYYLISIGFAHKWLGWGIEDSIIYSNIIFDSLTYVMVYLLAKRVTGNLLAMFYALLASFSPISLFFIAYRGLNAPIMNFSFLLFIYFFMEKRDGWAMFFLAFSLLTKQFPFFMAMPVGFWLVRRYGFAKGVSYYLLGIIFVLLLSVPYILITPRLFVLRYFGPGSGKSSIYCPNNSEATNLFHSMIPVEACNGQFGSEYAGNMSLDKLIPNYQFLFRLVNGSYLFYGGLILIAWVGFTGYHYLEENPRLYYAFFAAYYFVAHATIARGIYKYYLTFLVPLFVLSLVRGHANKSVNISIGRSLHKGWKTWSDPKYRHQEATIRYWLYGVNLLICTLGIFWMANGLISIFAKSPHDQNLFRILIFPIILLLLIKPGNYNYENNSQKLTTKRVLSEYTMILPLAGVLLFAIVKLGKLYFDNNIPQFNYYLIVFMIVVFAFTILPFSAKIQSDSLLPVFNKFEMRQMALDTVNLIIAFVILAFWHVTVLTVHRFYTSLVLLLFSFLPLAMLGPQIWSSGYLVPYRAYNKFLQLIRYTQTGEKPFPE